MELEKYILQSVCENAILEVDSVHDEIMATLRVKVEKEHPYTLTPPKTEGGRWQTSYIDGYGKRKNLKAQTKEELLDKLIPIYFSDSHIDKLTFYGLYEEWLEYKVTVTNSPNTIKRHRQHYKKYFEESALHDMKVKEIDELLLEKECNRIVKEFNLSRKEWYNARTILNGMYEYAVRKKYLAENPMEKVQVLVKFKQVVKKTGKTETFNTKELADMNLFLENMYEEDMDASYLAVKINFLLGLRVGELVSLKWSDWLPESNQLHIVREEIRDQTKNCFEVADHTKTNQDRFVLLVPKAVEILKRIEKQGEYIFMRGGERITANRIAVILRQFAKYEGIPVKSSHKMRKTYASTLNANGVPLDFIREMLGHNNLNTTLGYIYNPLTESQTYDLMANALQ